MKKHNIKNDISPMSLMSLILSFLSLFVISGLLFLNPKPETYMLLIGLDTLICSLFFIQLTADLLRAKNKTQYLKEHWVDYLASIPLIEPLRFGRIFQILRVIKILRSGKHLFQQLNDNRRETTIASILLLLLLLITLGSSAIFFAENGQPNANINSASDAIWWSIVTISTVGYGDLYPTSTLGRIIASVILICGVSIFGMISGLITSFITSPNKRSPAHLLQRNNELLEKLISEQQALISRIELLEKTEHPSSPKAEHSKHHHK